MKKWPQRLPAIAVLLLLCALLAWGFWPVPIEVEMVRAKRGTFSITVEDDGKTRIREKYTVSAPVYGKLFRIELEEGDAVVESKTVLARIEPSDPTLLDARAQAEAEARVRASEATVSQAESSLQRANEACELAKHEYARAQGLIKTRAISASEFDQAEHEERMAKAERHSAEFALAVARFENDLAKAALIRTKPTPPGDDAAGILTITSPVNGQVLRIREENAGVVTPGMPLLEIGDPRDLEMEIDVLSTDAVKVRPGSKVYVEHWGGPGTLEGRVRVVEPSGFLKISALGVEEQRVNVIADFIGPYEKRRSLGDGYRIEARIVVDEATEVISVPAGTLFREHGAWHVFRIVNGRARLQAVEVGKSNGQETEILKGIAEGDPLILHPTDAIEDGTRVRWN